MQNDNAVSVRQDATLKIFVVDRDGVEHELPAVEGWRVMEIVRDWGLDMKGECGGACACATCHVYVDRDWMDAITPASEEEIDQLDLAPATEVRSRLACQILMRPEFDGLRLRLAPGSEAG
jgi:2Fe-2S ferredoxin